MIRPPVVGVAELMALELLSSARSVSGPRPAAVPRSSTEPPRSLVIPTLILHKLKTTMPPPQTLVQQLVALGIPKQKASYALSEHNNDVEAAGDWAFGEVSPLPFSTSLTPAVALAPRPARPDAR